MTPNHDDKLLAAIFPEEWYTKVLKAAEFALDKIICSEYQAHQIVKDIIDFNIQKRIKEVLSESAELVLPKALNWSKLAILDAFDAFKVILDACDICEDLVSYTAELTLGKNNTLYNELLIWKECVNTKYPNLTVDLIDTDKKGVFFLKVKKDYVK